MLSVAEELIALDGEIVEGNGADPVAGAVVNIVIQDTHAIAGNDNAALVGVRDIEAGDRDVGGKDSELADDAGRAAGDRTIGDRCEDSARTQGGDGDRFVIRASGNRDGIAGKGGCDCAGDVAKRARGGEAVDGVIVAVRRDEVVRGAEG